MVRTARLVRTSTPILVLFCAFGVALMLCAGPVHAQNATSKDEPGIASSHDMAACESPGRITAVKGAPLTVEVMDQFGPYGSDQVTMVSDTHGMPLLTAACDGPISVFQLPAGDYRVQSFVGDVRSAEVAVNVPPAGKHVALMLDRPSNMPVNSTAMD